MRTIISNIAHALQSRPVVLHLCGVILVPLGIIFLPVLLYGTLFQTTVPFAIAVKNIPWGPVILVVAIAALLSLLQMPRGIQIQRTKPVKETSKLVVSTDTATPAEKEAIASLKVDIIQSNKDADNEGMAVSVPEKTL